MQITTLGIDLAKSAFQFHGVDADGAVVLQKKLRRGAVLDFLGQLQPCLIGLEACATSHHWTREIAAQGPRKVVELVARLREGDGLEVPALARAALMALAAQLDSLASQIRGIERQLMAWHRQSGASQRLEKIPGVGLITATALAASVPDPSVFKSARQFAAWLGLVPRQNSTGGKERLGRVSKMGNGYLRRPLVVGATSVSRRAGADDSRTGLWVRSLLERKPARLVTVAIANKTARSAWALLVRGETYKAAPAA